MRIKKGDTVKILYGKDSGKKGKVVAVDMKNSKVVVEGINIYKRHVKGDGRTKTSEIISIVKPMNISKVILICNNCGKSTRVGIKRTEGVVSRVCKKCGKDIEIVKEVEKKETVKKESKAKKTTKEVSAKKESKAKTVTKKKDIKK